MIPTLASREFWRIALFAIGIASAPAAYAHEQTTALDSAPIAAPGDPAAFADAAKTIDAFHAALSKGDRELALSFLDGRVQIYEQGRVERSKTEYASHHLESDAKFSAATTNTRTARSGMTLGDFAYVTSEGTITGAFNGKVVDSITLETMVLRREQGSWQIVHIHWSSRDAKK